jgi:hypothetical protein
MAIGDVWKGRCKTNSLVRSPLNLVHAPGH